MGPYKVIYCIFANIIVVNAKGHAGGHGSSHGGHSSHAAAHGSYGGHAESFHHTTARHAFYSYHPPARVYYMCHQCFVRQSYPVYHGLPPTYVFTYRESGNRYGDLLTGLSLYNLGRASEKNANYMYTAEPSERCSLQIIDRKHFEETRVPCFMISSFMVNSTKVQGPESQTFDISKAHIEVKSYMNTTGTPIVVTSTQECVLWHNLTVHQEKHMVPCALLKEYSKSISYSGIPVHVWLPLLLFCVVAICICCLCFDKKKKGSNREDCPLNEARVVAYRASNSNNDNND